MHCFDGLDRGKGFVVLSNGDNAAVMFQCELCRALLKGEWQQLVALDLPQGYLPFTSFSPFHSCLTALDFSGVDFARYKDSDLVYDFTNMKQETIVNRGQCECLLIRRVQCAFCLLPSTLPPLPLQV